MTPRHNDIWFEDDELVREGGVFLSPNVGREVSCDDDDCAPGDYAEDPASEVVVPGTIDDLPYDYGVELSHPADEVLESLDRGSKSTENVGVSSTAEDAAGAGAAEPDAGLS
ncbi:MAG: hypothetical protein Q7J82_03160 [Coriobacteriia bacterium]|nr:hypothetical protein [Coriobacteriia bacterium]